MEYCKLPVNSIKLDIDNPRIRHWMENHSGKVDAEAIALALSGGDSNGYRALRDSIVANGGIITPIIVNRVEGGDFVVIEGNTRVQIYKDLLEQKKDNKWSEILAIVHDNLPKTEIHAIRLQSHLVGPREWMPFSKAKYLYYLSEKKELPMSELISLCGGVTKGSEIRKLIEAYKDYVTHYVTAAENADMDADPQEFSKFVECQRQPVVNALLQNGYTKSDFARWVVDGHVDTAQNVRLLPSILADKDARQKFLKTNIKEASELLIKAKSEATSIGSYSLYELAEEVYRKLKLLPYDEFKALKHDPDWRRYNDILHVLNEALQDKISDIDGEDI